MEKAREAQTKGGSKDSKEKAQLRKSISSNPVLIELRDNTQVSKAN